MRLVRRVDCHTISPGILSVEDDHHFRRGSQFTERNAQQRKEAEDSGDIAGFVPAPDPSGEAEPCAPQKIVAIDNEQGNIWHLGTSVRLVAAEQTGGPDVRAPSEVRVCGPDYFAGSSSLPLPLAAHLLAPKPVRPAHTGTSYSTPPELRSCDRLPPDQNLS